MYHDPSHQTQEPVSFWRTRYAVGLLVMGAIATYFLMSEHRAHFVGALPLLLLLACPLMHVFMHQGRGGHGDGHDAHQQHKDASKSHTPATAPTTAPSPKTGEQP